MHLIMIRLNLWRSLTKLKMRQVDAIRETQFKSGEVRDKTRANREEWGLGLCE